MTSRSRRTVPSDRSHWRRVFRSPLVHLTVCTVFLSLLVLVLTSASVVIQEMSWEVSGRLNIDDHMFDIPRRFTITKVPTLRPTSSTHPYSPSRTVSSKRLTVRWTHALFGCLNIHLIAGPGIGLEIDESLVRETSAIYMNEKAWRNDVWRGADGSLREW
jgi:hypothetical protein